MAAPQGLPPSPPAFSPLVGDSRSSAFAPSCTCADEMLMAPRPWWDHEAASSMPSSSLDSSTGFASQRARMPSSYASCMGIAGREAASSAPIPAATQSPMIVPGDRMRGSSDGPARVARNRAHRPE
ncbi:MAG TPA: hypothetical protein DCM87_06750 [Planctomycetes bacterium]|nr:hypothetical protein [Planctomycetota bacterium]